MPENPSKNPSTKIVVRDRTMWKMKPWGPTFGGRLGVLVEWVTIVVKRRRGILPLG